MELVMIECLKPNHSKIWHPYKRFSDRNFVQSAIQIKSDKNNVICIQRR